MVAEENGEDDVVAKGFGVGTVSDVVQTDGDPLPDPLVVERVGEVSDGGMLFFVVLVNYVAILKSSASPACRISVSGTRQGSSIG